MSALEDFLNGPYGWLAIFAVIMLFTAITVIFYFKRDKYDPEPLWWIFVAFIYGIISVIPALILSLIATLFVPTVLLQAIIVAPVVEEIVKLWFVIILSRNDEFDGPLDGLIYGAMVGAGFAAAENLLYGLNILFAAGILEGIGLATLRSLTQIIGHPFYTGLAGMAVGEVKVGLGLNRYRYIGRSILLHALWNLIASIDLIVWVGLIGLSLVNIYILRQELRKAIKLDKEAYERGYYEQKKIYLEYKKRMRQRVGFQYPQVQAPFQRPPPQQPWQRPPPQQPWHGNSFPPQRPPHTQNNDSNDNDNEKDQNSEDENPAK